MNKSPLKIQMTKEMLSLKMMADLVRIHNEFVRKVDEYNKLVDEKVGPKGDDGITPIKGQDYFTEEEIEEIVETVYSKIVIPEVKDGNDGKTPTEDELIALIKPLIPPQQTLQSLSKDDVSKIVKSLIPKVDYDLIAEKAASKVKPIIVEKEEEDEDLAEEFLALLNEGKIALTTKHISGLEEQFRILANQIGRKGGGGGGGGSTVKVYDISSQLNGILKTFTIPRNSRILAIHSYSHPYSAFVPNTDFTSTVTSITFGDSIDAATQLATGQVILIEYVEA